MSETEKKEERILPTEEGAWWASKRGYAPEIIKVSERRYTNGTTELVVYWGQTFHDPADSPAYDWLAPVPTPEQLAAMAAKIAAGQALADAERVLDAMYDEAVTDNAEWQGGRHSDALEAAQNATADLLAAFPPVEGGGR